ncbi:hypothetical protein Scep_014090 [Stephania cephalantha]|uniref:Uncharacterized protein n=1 Tax=Stephania cephalantha TaxID=152367 RepID=A0AAP0P097_9MAGN
MFQNMVGRMVETMNTLRAHVVAQVFVVCMAQEVPIVTLAAHEEHATSVVCPRVKPIVVVLVQVNLAVASGMSWEERHEELDTIISMIKPNTVYEDKAQVLRVRKDFQQGLTRISKRKRRVENHCSRLRHLLSYHMYVVILF